MISKVSLLEETAFFLGGIKAFDLVVDVYLLPIMPCFSLGDKFDFG